MRIYFAALGLGLAMPGMANAFVAPAGGLITAALLRSSGPRSAVAPTRDAPGCSSSTATDRNGIIATSGWPSPARRRALAALSARASRDEVEAGGDRPSSAAAMSGIGSTGSNVLLLVATAMVLKGLFLPEDIRHLGFCPPDDPVRGRDTLPWRMMIESGRECGTIQEVMTKYVTAPVVFPGTPEWGMMLNVKEELAKDLPLN